MTASAFALPLHADEVALLEGYRDSQRADEARTRFDARLSKTQAIAVKKQPRDSTARASIRAIRSPTETRELRRAARAPDVERERNAGR